MCKNCPIPFIPGFSALRGEPQSPEENEKSYEESQRQRALERKARGEKLKLSAMEAQGADDEAFCDETGRTRRRYREYTPVKATWPENISKTGYLAAYKKFENRVIPDQAETEG